MAYRRDKKSLVIPSWELSRYISYKIGIPMAEAKKALRHTVEAIRRAVVETGHFRFPQVGKVFLKRRRRSGVVEQMYGPGYYTVARLKGVRLSSNVIKPFPEATEEETRGLVPNLGPKYVQLTPVKYSVGGGGKKCVLCRGRRRLENRATCRPCAKFLVERLTAAPLVDMKVGRRMSKAEKKFRWRSLKESSKKKKSDHETA